MSWSTNGRQYLYKEFLYSMHKFYVNYPRGHEYTCNISWNQVSNKFLYFPNQNNLLHRLCNNALADERSFGEEVARAPCYLLLATWHCRQS